MLDLNKDAKIYKLLKKSNKEGNNWWTRLCKDNDIYVDIRQNDIINIYHNGGSILKITNEGTAIINYAYLPTDNSGTYATCEITDDKIKLKNEVKINLDDLSEEKITQIKKLIENYYPKNSEKGIQGAYATAWKKDKPEQYGFFIDTELQYHEDGRIDLVYLYYQSDDKPVLYFVELKTKGDDRLWDTTDKNKEKNICNQLEKYKKFINENETEIIKYYKTLYEIKKELNLIPMDASNNINIENLSIEHKPILLIGDATNDFIYKDNKTKELSDKMTDLQDRIKDCACMIICRGIGTNTLNFHSAKSGNIFKL